MSSRRQQRLEQEQADIEHEIRVIQSKPAVNKLDTDKVTCILMEILVINNLYRLHQRTFCCRLYHIFMIGGFSSGDPIIIMLTIHVHIHMCENYI